MTTDHDQAAADTIVPIISVTRSGTTISAALAQPADGPQYVRLSLGLPDDQPDVELGLSPDGLDELRTILGVAAAALIGFTTDFAGAPRDGSPVQLLVPQNSDGVYPHAVVSAAWSDEIDGWAYLADAEEPTAAPLAWAPGEAAQDLPIPPPAPPPPVPNAPNPAAILYEEQRLADEADQ